MSAAYLCAEAGISPVVIGNQAAYVAGWLEKLCEDRKLLVRAAAQAQKAADYILGRSAEPPDFSVSLGHRRAMPFCRGGRLGPSSLGTAQISVLKFLITLRRRGIKMACLLWSAAHRAVRICCTAL